MRYDRAGTDYLNDGTIEDGAILAAPGVRLTNSGSGRLYGGVLFEAAGATFSNGAGGIVRLSRTADAFGSVAITGSAGADTVVNAGLIGGAVRLGDGADSFTDAGGTSYGVELGAGDDSYRVEGTAYQYNRADGGIGRDRLTVANTSYTNDGQFFTGFEDAVFEAGGNLVNFSGFSTLALAPTAVRQIFNFVSSRNPLADLGLAGQFVILYDSAVRSVAGSEGADHVQFSTGSSVAGDVRLGAGDDVFQTFENAPNTPAYSIAGAIDGGAGTDTASFVFSTAGTRTFDVTRFTGFERVDVNAGTQVSSGVSSTLRGADGYERVTFASRAALTIVDSDMATGFVSGGFGGALTLAADTRIGRYGFPPEGFDTDLDRVQADDQLSLALTNAGTVVGNVEFYIGDDTYDGRAGSVGGIVYGNAGNDTLLGGAGAERMRGGYGADRLDGGAGDDLLAGGFGADRIAGGDGVDTASYADDGAGVAVNLDLGRGFGNSAEGDVLSGIENVVGSARNDFVVGEGGTNRLDGGAGDDRLIGSLGADVLVGGDGIDTASYEDNWGGVFVNLDTARGFGNAAQGDSYQGIENLVGGLFADFFIGNGGANLLDGAGGDDRLLGSLGADLLIGGDGRDTASYEDNSGTVFVNLAAGRGYGNAAEGDGFGGIEDLVGGLFDDFFIGDAGANRLDGAMGADTLIGGEGADTFVFSYAPGATSAFGGANADQVRDFASGTDRIELAAAAFGGLSTGALAAEAFALGSSATTQDQRFLYDQATGRLFFDRDGSFADPTVLVATFGEANHPVLGAGDFMVV